MPKIDISHRLRKIIGKMMRCKDIANFFTINLQDPDNGNSVGSDTFATCLSQQDFANIAYDAVEKVLKTEGYEYDDVWVNFDKMIGNRAIKISSNYINFNM